MMKKWIALLLAAMMCLSLWACGEDTPDKTQPNGTVNNQGGNNNPTTAPTAESTQPTTAPGIPLSDDPSDFTFSIDGVVYQFPCSPQVFFANGWLPVMDWILEDDYEYPADAKGIIALYKEGENKKFDLRVCNLSKNAEPLSEVIVIGISGYTGTDVEIVLGGGFTLTSTATAEDVHSFMENYDASINFDVDVSEIIFSKKGNYVFTYKNEVLYYFDIRLAEAVYKN
jgi:hypothetical protein